MPNKYSFQANADFHIRRLGIADANRFKSLRVEASRESPASRYPTPEEELARSIDEFEKQLSWDAYNFVFGALDRHELVGIAGLRRPRGMKIQHTAVLWGIYVTPQYRSRGVAKRLIGALLDIAGGIAEVTQITLRVHTKNPSTRQVYSSCGFNPYGIERNVLRIGEESFDEELMMKTLR